MSSRITRRMFLASTGAPLLASGLAAEIGGDHADAAARPFTWTTPQLQFAYDVSEGKLRQRVMLPAGFPMASLANSVSSGVETAIQLTGEDSPDPGMKQGAGQPGIRLILADHREESTSERLRLVLTQSDPVTKIRVESFYQAFDGVPVVRRWTKVTNEGAASVGIDFLSSAMLHGLADGQNFERELIIHLAWNSWMAEAQWHAFRPSQLGFVENERTS